MTGLEIIEWRKRNGYTQRQLQIELGIKSNGTISSWENSKGKISRVTELALIALEKIPELRNTSGKTETTVGRVAYRKRFGDNLSAK